MFIGYQAAPVLYLQGSVGVDIEKWSVDSLIEIWQGDQLILSEYNAGNVTNLGDNMTLLWIFGNEVMGVMQDYSTNCTWISIGNQGALPESATQLPGEWNRTTATFDTEIQSGMNITCIFYPDNSGLNGYKRAVYRTYTADCIGINCASSGDGNLIFADAFTEVTGIDETFTSTSELLSGEEY